MSTRQYEGFPPCPGFECPTCGAPYDEDWVVDPTFDEDGHPDDPGICAYFPSCDCDDPVA
jgi:hypothetical protein